MSGSVKCPNCFQPVPKGNRFCIFCGNDLSGVEEAEPLGKWVRLCANGHRIDDPNLKFCTVCGLPLYPAAPSGGPAPEAGKSKRRWECACGEKNDVGALICRTCGKPKGWSSDSEPAKSSEPKIPEGMRSPVPEDLLHKS